MMATEEHPYEKEGGWGGERLELDIDAEPTPDSGPSKESQLRLSELRDLGVEAGWGDKFYAALAALWQVVKGTEIPAMGTPPHIVMADLIEDIAWPTPDSGLDVERLRPPVEAGIREWWNDLAREDHAVGINLSDPTYRRKAFADLAARLSEGDGSDG
jgi:hypothetical protein